MSLSGLDPSKETLTNKLKRTTVLIYYNKQFVSSGIIFKINNTTYCITAGHSIYGNGFDSPKGLDELQVQAENILLDVEEVIGDSQFAKKHDIVILKIKKSDNTLDIPNIEFWPIPQSRNPKLVYRGSYNPEKGIHNFWDTHFDETEENSTKFKINVKKEYLVNSEYNHGSDWLGGISGSGLFYEDKESVCCCGIIIEIINKGNEGKVLCASIEALTPLLPELTIIASPLLPILFGEIIYYGQARFKSVQLNEEVKAAFDLALNRFSSDPLPTDEKYRLHQSLKKIIYNINHQKETDHNSEANKLLDLFKEELYKYPNALSLLTRERLHYFESKINALSQFEELISLEDVFLKYYNVFLSIEDLKENKYYENIPVLEQVNNFLDTENICLLSGSPGSGKTVLAKIIGFQFEQKDIKNIAFYLDLRISDDLNIKNILKEIDSIENSLLIIDNCHKNIALIERLMDRWQPRHTKLLLVSRPISDVNDDLNFQSILSNRLADIIIDEKLVKGIIEKRLSRDNYNKLQIGDTDRLIQKIEGSFHLLNYYLEVWESNTAKILSEIENVEIFPKVYTNYIKPYNDKILSILALFGAFEIKLEQNYFSLEEMNALEKLIELGFVERFILPIPNTIVEEAEILTTRVYVQYFHSSPSKYIIDTLEHFGKSVPKVEYFISYLETLPYNFSEIFYQVHQNKSYIESGFLRDLIGEIKIRNLYKKWIEKYGDFVLKNQTTLFNHYSFQKTLSVENIEYSKICLELFYNMFLVSSYKKKYYKNTLLFFRILFTFRLSSTIANLFLSETIDFRQLGQQAEKDQLGIGILRNLPQMLRQNGVSKSSITVFYNAINFKRLGEQAEKDQVGISSISNLFISLRQSEVSKFSILIFSNAINFKRLGEQTEKDQVGIATISRLTQILSQSGVPKSSIISFSNAINFKRLGEQTEKDQVGITTIRNLTQILSQSGVSKSSIISFSNAINFRRLGEQAEKDQVGIATIQVLVINLSRSGVSKSSIISFSNAINFKRLGEQTEKDQVGIATIRSFVGRLRLNGVSKPAIISFYNALNFKRLGEQVEKDQASISNIINLVRYYPWSTKKRDNIKIFLSCLNLQNFALKTAQDKISPGTISKFINQVSFYESHHASDIELFWETLFNLTTPIQSLKYIKNHLQHWNYRAFGKYLKKVSLKEDLEKPNTFILKDISFLLYQINDPKYRILEIYLLSADLKQIDFINCIPKSQLSGISYFLFNFQYAQSLSHLSAFFALQLDDQQEVLLNILSESSNDLAIIDNFVWNLLMSYPTDKIPSIFTNEALQDIIVKKDRNELALLSLIGMMAYLSINFNKLQASLTLEEKTFIEIQEILEERSPRSLRILYGLSYVNNEQFISLFSKYFEGPKEYDSDLYIVNQELFKDRLRDLFDRY